MHLQPETATGEPTMVAAAEDTTEQPRSSLRHVNSLDGFRGLAFLLVFFRHYTLTSHMTSNLARKSMAVGQGGWVGVDLFFALSGFLITRILINSVGQKDYYRNFYARRSLRIFPLYYGVFLVLFLATPWLYLQWHRGHLAFLFYLGNFAIALHSSLAGVAPDVTLLHLWSLSVEEQFYLIWPFVIAFVLRRRSLLFLCAGLSLCSLMIRVVLLLVLPHNSAFEWSYLSLPTHVDGLLYGAIAAILLQSRSVEACQTGARRLSIVAGLLLGVIYITSGFDFHSVAMDTIGYSALALLSASVIVQALSPGSWAAWLGNLGFLRWMGKYSYGLYVYHYLFSPIFGRLEHKLQNAVGSTLWGGLLSVLLMFLSSIVMAVLSFRFYEMPWLRLKRYFVS